jgi:Flp pilus assembly pilin Flp
VLFCISRRSSYHRSLLPLTCGLNAPHAVIACLPLVFAAIVIVVTAAAIAAGAKGLIENSLGGLSYARVLANLASGFILAIGVIAALDQLHIAAIVVNAVLYAVLAALVGIAIVAIGGGGIKTMTQRWEAVAARYDEEKPKIAAATRNAPAVTDQARQYADDRSPSASTGTEPYLRRPDDPGRS